MLKKFVYCTLFSIYLLSASDSKAQTPPSSDEVTQYSPFFKAVIEGDVEKTQKYISQGDDLEQRDTAGRTALHIAAYESNEEMFTLLVQAGSNVNAFENDEYDVVTIAAVANDIEMLELALSSGGDAKNTTSPYKGTALIASAHLGHVKVVEMLLKAGSNIDHVNNLGWTALLEAIILGNGSSNYIKVVELLMAFGADKAITDNQGVLPISHARQRGYTEIVHLLE
ncbi:ankyrin repeat domain-containing protein [Sneathiella aquimaris]|uniref:ankyrin repeat domain-containing protein n=1 Tax=Sneathiella aquimaris TaxID=2599305 RepID=UPI00146DC463|nr:ankyrin repeat domain-containing protein [Sneathiella aquimaris]